MSIFTEIEKGLENIWKFITSPKAAAAVAEASSLVSIALPIVQELSTLIVPASSTLAQVDAAYTKYGIPLVEAYAQNPTSIGNALLNLATQLLRAKLPPSQANIATNILNTAVQLAVTVVKNA
jgi:hypothetical protein